MAFVFRAVDEVGATLNTALVVMGDKLGYYRAMADGRRRHPGRAGRADRRPSEHYAREWLNTQAAGGYVEYDPDTAPVHAAGRARRRARGRDSPAYLPGFFQIALGTVRDAAEHHRGGPRRRRHRLARARPRRPRRLRAVLPHEYNAHLLAEWLPALDGVVEKLERGRQVADVGCGHGASTILMAEAFPHSTFVGSDYHEASIEIAARAGGAGRASATGCVRGRARDRRSPGPATTW